MQPGQGAGGWSQPPPPGGWAPPAAGQQQSYGYDPNGYGAGPSSYSQQPAGYPQPYGSSGTGPYGKGSEESKPAGYPGAYQQQQQQQYMPPPAAAAAMPPRPPPEAMDVESGAMQSAMAFAETRVRNGFVRKVFGIVTIQLLITVGFAAACMYVPEINRYVRYNQWPFYTAWGLSIVLMLVIVCVEKARRSYPLNMFILFMFTIAMAFLVGMITARFTVEVVMLAFLITAVAVGGITIFAVNTKIDATKWGSMLMVAGFAFIALIFVGIFWINNIVYLVIAGVSALLFSAYLIYDIQLIMGGKTYSLSPDEYVFAALSVYMDIVNIFLAILQIVGFASNN